MKNIILVFYCIISFNLSCLRHQEPETPICIDPDICQYASNTIKIRAYLSGNTNSIIRIGDTLRFYARIPDTLTITKGPNQKQQLIFKNMYNENKNIVGLSALGGDTIFPDDNFRAALKKDRYNSIYPYFIYEKYSGLTPFQPYPKWDKNAREVQGYAVLRQSGKYYFELGSPNFAIVTTDDKKWLLNVEFSYFDQQTRLPLSTHYNQFIKRIPRNYHKSAESYFFDRPNLYYFEVAR